MQVSSLAPQSVGIDVAKAKIDVCILWNVNQTIAKSFANQKAEDMQDLARWLKENGVLQETPIVVESTGSYHWLSCLMLSENGFRVHLINPVLTKRYERSSIRGSKTDSIDAKRLAEMALIETDLPLFYDSRESLSAKKYQSLYAKIQKVKQQLTRSYKDAMESAKSIGMSLDLHSIEDCLNQIGETIKVLRKIIEENVSEDVQELAKVRGISKFQASVICNAVEGRSFETKSQLIAFFGLDIRKRESGTWKGIEHLSKRGNAFYRMVLFQIGWSLARNNPQFKEYYERLRNDGKHYFTCIIATARKFLKYFFVYFLNKKLQKSNKQTSNALLLSVVV